MQYCTTQLAEIKVNFKQTEQIKPNQPQSIYNKKHQYHLYSQNNQISVCHVVM